RTPRRRAASGAPEGKASRADHASRGAHERNRGLQATLERGAGPTRCAWVPRNAAIGRPRPSPEGRNLLPLRGVCYPADPSGFQPLAARGGPSRRRERSAPGVTTPTIVSEGAPGAADRDDVERARAGDARAFERLYRRHAARVHGLARRM